MEHTTRIYKSTEFICNMYDISKDFLFNRIKNGVFLQNVHFIKQSKVIRWDTGALQRWWEGQEEDCFQQENIKTNTQDPKVSLVLNKLLT
ncbi:MAG: hypothetical protein AB7D43_13145 [Sulfurimonadaceae bacterium]